VDFAMNFPVSLPESMALPGVLAISLRLTLNV
jgi:hypothetical protein